MSVCVAVSSACLSACSPVGSLRYLFLHFLLFVLCFVPHSPVPAIPQNYVTLMIVHPDPPIKSCSRDWRGIRRGEATTGGNIAICIHNG